MTALTHPVTGHQLNTDDESVEFWEAAGYRAEKAKAPAKKRGGGQHGPVPRTGRP